jgi:alkylation response protein AidB-like acyl-CoA dehydrogenase
MQHPSRPTEPRQEVVDLAAGLVPGLAARAAGYDEADAFCHEDLDELVAAGYTAITVPADLGGMGASALDLVAAQSRLAEGNPATALAVNMHLHGVGLLAEDRKSVV